ncbi:MAG: hypothetical protein AB1696_10345 [Planctomycetota bacterium]
MADTQVDSAGVQQLINKLREEGVQAGRQEADRVVQEARQQAAKIVAQAKAEADETRAKARAEIEAEHSAAIDALHLAARDTQIRLREMVKSTFAVHVKRLVSEELQDRDFLRQIILAIVERAVPRLKEGQSAEILISDEIFEAEDKRGKLTEKGKEYARQFLLNVTGEMMREGIEIKPAGDKKHGVRLRLSGEDVEIDMSDEAISDLLVKHMVPRYRTLVLGME